MPLPHHHWCSRWSGHVVLPSLPPAPRGHRCARGAVETHWPGLAVGCTIVGLPETAVHESKRPGAQPRCTRPASTSRVGRVTVNLAPADLPKEERPLRPADRAGHPRRVRAGTGQPLGVLEFAGELALSGDLRPIRGVLAMTHRRAPRRSVRSCCRSIARARRHCVPGALVHPARSLAQVCAHLAGRDAAREHIEGTAPGREQPTMARPRRREGPGAGAARARDRRGRRAHPADDRARPARGKTMLAQRLPGILPPLVAGRGARVAAMQSAARGFASERCRRRDRSARRTTPPRAVALVGGGAHAAPGRDHRSRTTACCSSTSCRSSTAACWRCCASRWRTGVITISRAAQQADFPARFQLVAAMNPCPCGYLGHHSAQCRCTPDRIARYRGRLSGPAARSHRPARRGAGHCPKATWTRCPAGRSSALVRARVQARATPVGTPGHPECRARQRRVEPALPLDAAARNLLREAVSRLALSARGYHRVLKVARTIADLERVRCAQAHVAEALQYRSRGSHCRVRPIECWVRALKSPPSCSPPWPASSCGAALLLRGATAAPAPRSAWGRAASPATEA